MYSILGQLATGSLINFEMVKAYIRLCDYSTSNAIRKKECQFFTSSGGGGSQSRCLIGI